MTSNFAVWSEAIALKFVIGASFDVRPHGMKW